MHTSTRYISNVLLLLLLPVLACCGRQDIEEYSCTDPLGCVRIDPKEEIQIGVLQALSGAIAPLGRAQMRGLGLALDKRGGELLGHKIKLQIEDTGCTAEGGANAALKLIAEPQIVAIFGTTCSGAAATASKAMSAAGLTMISGNNSAPFLTSIAGKTAPNWQPGYFRTAPNEERAGQAAAEFAFMKLGIRKAAVIHDNDIYTKGLAGSFRKGFEELGGSIVLYTSVSKGDSEMEPVLNAVASFEAELLFFPLFQPEGNHIVRQARQVAGMSETILMSDGALIQDSFLEDMGHLATGMYFVGPAKSKGAAARALAVKYTEKYKEAPAVSYYLSGYDAAGILLQGIEKSAEQTEDGTLYIGRQNLRDTIYALNGYDGVTGALSCNEFGDCGRPVFNVLRLDDPSLGLKGLESNVLYSLGLR